MLIKIICLSPFKYRDICSFLKRTAQTPLDSWCFEVHYMIDRCQAGSTSMYAQTQPGRIKQLFYNSILWILFSCQSVLILWWRMFFLLKLFLSSHGGQKLTLQMKAGPLGKISVLPMGPSGRKLQNRIRLEIVLQKLAAFACIYYRDTRAVFASIEKAKRFWHSSSWPSNVRL